MDVSEMDVPPFAPPGVATEPWRESEVLVRSTLVLPTYSSRVTDHLFRHARNCPDRVFLQERRDEAWHATTYGTAAAMVRSIGSCLLRLGLGAHRPLVVLSGNSVAHALIGLAAQAVGIPYAPISPPYSLASQDLKKLRHVLGVLTPGAIFVEHERAFLRALAVPEAQDLPVIAVVPEQGGRACPFADLLRESEDADLDARIENVDPAAPIKILFTSGSTGMPKGVITTHRMMAANQEQIATVWPFLRSQPPILLDWLPWNHVFGNSHNLGMVLRHGGTLWIDDGRPLPGAFERTLRNLRNVQPTISFNVPKAYELLIPELENDDELANYFFGRLRLMFYAGAALAPPLWRRLEKLAAKHASQPVEMVSSWGLTETAPAILMVHEAGAPAGCIGTPMPGLTLKLIPNEDKMEARVSGPNVTPGYWRDPVATQAAFDEDGYFRTGDAVRWIDPQNPTSGFRFDGRLTEDFKLSSGTRVNAGEVKLLAMTSLSSIARDLLVVGENRDEIGLLLIPHDAQRNQLGAGLPENLRAELSAALQEINRSAGGSSRRIGRAMFLSAPLSLDSGEITDKGSLNIRAILRQRSDQLERLYEGDGDVVVA